MGNKIIITYDQAHFKIDADIRKCWYPIGKTPIVYKNGSKKAINIGGAYTSTKEFHFYRMETQNKKEVLNNLKMLRLKYPNMFLLLDKAPWNKNKTIIKFLKHHNIEHMFFPTGASDLNATEFCWKITRDNKTANTSHNSEEELYQELKSYWKTQPFNHNLLNYLEP